MASISREEQEALRTLAYAVKRGEASLEDLADKLNFAHCERDPTSMDPLIIGRRPYYYIWTRENGMDILTFKDPLKPKTAKLFCRTHEEIYDVLHLDSDTPTFRGKAVIDAIMMFEGPY